TRDLYHRIGAVTVCAATAPRASPASSSVWRHLGTRFLYPWTWRLGGRRRRRGRRNRRHRECSNWCQWNWRLYRLERAGCSDRRDVVIETGQKQCEAGAAVGQRVKRDGLVVGMAVGQADDDASEGKQERTDEDLDVARVIDRHDVLAGHAISLLVATAQIE